MYPTLLAGDGAWTLVVFSALALFGSVLLAILVERGDHEPEPLSGFDAAMLALVVACGPLASTTASFLESVGLGLGEGPMAAFSLAVLGLVAAALLAYREARRSGVAGGQLLCAGVAVLLLALGIRLLVDETALAAGGLEFVAIPGVATGVLAVGMAILEARRADLAASSQVRLAVGVALVTAMSAWVFAASTELTAADRSIPSYFAAMMIGYGIAAVLLVREGKRQGFDAWQLTVLAISVLIAGVFGARLFHVLFDGFFYDYIALCTDPAALARELPNGQPCIADAQCIDAQQQGVDIGGICDTGSGECVPQQDCLRALKFWTGGLTYYGGLIFGLLAAVALCRRWGWSVLGLFDIAGPCIALAHFFGRVGCFFSGCCFGEVCAVPWGVQFPGGSEAYRQHVEEHSPALIEQYRQLGEWVSLPVHPTQLYEAGALLTLFALLWFGLRPRKRFEGEVFGWFLVLYGMARFTVEFWRADARGAMLSISTSQWISILLVPLGAWILMQGYRALRAGGEPDDPDEPDEPATETS